MTFDIGQNLAGILTSLVSIIGGVIVLWVKTSANHAETTAAVSAIADKVDEVHAATVDNVPKV